MLLRIVVIPRAAERILVAQGKYKKWGPYCVRGVWGHAPKKILRFYMH